jgi:hypothetical protein
MKQLCLIIVALCALSAAAHAAPRVVSPAEELENKVLETIGTFSKCLATATKKNDAVAEKLCGVMVNLPQKEFGKISKCLDGTPENLIQAPPLDQPGSKDTLFVFQCATTMVGVEAALPPDAIGIKSVREVKQ